MQHHAIKQTSIKQKQTRNKQNKTHNKNKETHEQTQNTTSKHITKQTTNYI